MFVLLSRVLLWLLIAVVAYALFQKFYPAGSFIGRLILGLLLFVLALAFINPNEPAVASLWRLVSFPLKPLGAAVLMMFFAAQKIKGGGIEKPGGYLLGWSLTILLLASTPAIAYFLVRAPIALVNDHNLVAMIPTTVTEDRMFPGAEKNQKTIAFNSSQNFQLPSYLLENPQEIRTRGLRVEDFVPNAETLQLTTQVWESYLNQIYFFLRGHHS